MKAILETVSSVKINRDIDTADSPMGIIRKFYEDDPAAASQLKSGQVDETKSTFELISYDQSNIQADWKTPLYSQPAIKEELAHLESEGQVPSFVVCVSSIVAVNNYAL